MTPAASHSIPDTCDKTIGRVRDDRGREAWRLDRNGNPSEYVGVTTPSIPSSVLAMFEEAGWTADRSVPNDVPTTHPAHEVLRAFSGLRVGSTGTGESCARSDIDFGLLEVEPDEDVIRDWEGLLETTLVGVAEVHNAHGELWVASDGRCFGRSLIHDAFYFEGDSFSEAAERLLLGRKSRPLIHPKQDSVTLYGETYTPDHPDVYVYRSEEH